MYTLPIAMFNSWFKSSVSSFLCHVTHKCVVPETNSVRKLKSVQNIVIEPKISINVLFKVPSFL